MVRLLSAVFAALLIALPAHAAPAQPLALRADAMVDGARIELADLAVQPEGLARVDLGAAPAPGQSVRLSRAEVARLLRARGLPYRLADDGAAGVRVTRSGLALPGAQLLEAAEGYLRGTQAGANARIERQPGPLPELLLPHGAVTLSVRPPAPEALLRRHLTVWVDIAVDGHAVRSAAVAFTQRVLRPALVARRPLAPGQTPGCADLELREIDIGGFDAVLALRDCGAQQGRLVQPLAAGAPLQAHQLRQPSAVMRGEQVMLEFAQGAIVLQRPATALADGEPGQRIQVRLASAASALDAEVTGRSRVRISGP